jgi:hypothetical protein
MGKEANADEIQELEHELKATREKTTELYDRLKVLLNRIADPRCKKEKPLWFKSFYSQLRSLHACCWSFVNELTDEDFDSDGVMMHQIAERIAAESVGESTRDEKGGGQ